MYPKIYQKLYQNKISDTRKIFQILSRKNIRKYTRKNDRKYATEKEHMSDNIFKKYQQIYRKILRNKN